MGAAKGSNNAEAIFYQHGCWHRYNQGAEPFRHCWLSMVSWGVKLAVIVKMSTNANSDAESTSKGFSGAWLRPYSPVEVVVTDQGSGLKGVFEQKLEGMSVFQQETSTEAPTIEEQYGLARESFEPQTAAENCQLIVSDSARSRRCLASHHEFPAD